ncbi:MAG: aldehyde ferredoxin oxidoreductase family protein [Anaerolineaceae bacterium]|nr:aldehyde ferredoxin oxidoreductase family protein [Anaerolineaceae bacterium]
MDQDKLAAGYMGKVLWVDLSKGTCIPQDVPDETYRQFLSGSGLAAILSWREIPAKTDPLGPDNVLGFTSGLLTDTGSIFTGRWMVTGKSPLTGTWGEANCGGTFSPAIKRCGYDGIFFKGISNRPVYLHMDGSQAELRDADHLWGLDTIETERTLKRDLGGRFYTACIGTAGEKLSLIACISNDFGRMAGRSGLGAVMGSKKLKAIVLAGDQKTDVHDADRIEELSCKATHWAKWKLPLPPGTVVKLLGTLFRILPVWIAQDGLVYKILLDKWGTSGMNQVSIEMGDGPVQNWRGSNVSYGFKHSDTTNPDNITRHQVMRYQCSACPLGCGGIMQIPGRSETSHKIEYESVLSWGSMLLNEDLESILEANERLTRAGMDSISAGATMAFAFECYENGLISREDTGGIELSWGNSESILSLLDMMINRIGIGDLLADGSRLAAQRIGKGAEQYAMHAGGQELGMHDSRNDPGFALHASVDPTPGRHTNGSQLYYEMFQLWSKVRHLPRVKHIFNKDERYDPSPEKAAAAVASSRLFQLLGGTGVCLFGALIGVQRIPIFEWLNAATGWDISPEGYLEIGARIQTLKQVFNAREGVPLQHAINKRALGLPPQTQGANKGRTVDIENLVKNYWTASDWDPNTGIPTRECLEKLGLGEIVICADFERQ